MKNYKREMTSIRRNEEKVSILDLNCDELRTLYQEIPFCSNFSSDYENSLGVDEEEVYHYSGMFLEDMYQQGREESYNEEDFVQFITDYC